MDLSQTAAGREELRRRGLNPDGTPIAKAAPAKAVQKPAPKKAAPKKED